VSEARLESVYTDRIRAQEFLVHAEELLEDAQVEGLRTAARSIVLHAAVVAACDALLQDLVARVRAQLG